MAHSDLSGHGHSVFYGAGCRSSGLGFRVEGGGGSTLVLPGYSSALRRTSNCETGGFSGLMGLKGASEPIFGWPALLANRDARAAVTQADGKI